MRAGAHLVRVVDAQTAVSPHEFQAWPLMRRTFAGGPSGACLEMVDRLELAVELPARALTHGQNAAVDRQVCQPMLMVRPPAAATAGRGRVPQELHAPAVHSQASSRT